MCEVVVCSEDGNGTGMELEGMETDMEIEAAAERRTEEEKKMKKNDDSASAAAAADNTSSLVRWETFLPKIVLRVLLVEADDSTRQIIAALLRKCSYRVAAVPDGLKAWEVLKGRPHNIDLILTEVDLPSISGFALLTLIMEHEICKNIPVIMMSSQDSVSTVYKCMLRGAADFLVKPVRKNELRNLWQHVWRRQASGSVGLGPPDESVAQQKDEATAENNAISNYSSDYMDCIQRNRECIEKGSDAQSSCTKPELDAEGAEIERMQDLSYPQWGKPSGDMDIQKHEECNTVKENVQEYNNEDEGSIEPTGSGTNRTTCGEDLTSGDRWKQFHASGQAFESIGAIVNSSREAIDLIGAFDNYLKCSNKSGGSNAGINKVDSLPLLDLSLRRSHPSGSVNQVTDERQGLNHSDASAFSRYVNKTVQPGHSTSPSTCNQQNNHRTGSDKQLLNHTVNYNSDSREPTISPKQIHFAAGQLRETELPFPNHQQRLLPAPIPVRGIRFQSLSNAFGSLIPPVFCAQSSPSRMQSPGLVSHQEPSFQVNSIHLLNHETGDSQQIHGSMNQNTNDVTDNSDNKEGHKLESPEERGHLSSATDQSANSSFCNGTLTHLHNLGCGSNGRMDTVPFMSTECGNEEAFRIREGNSLRSVQREAALTKFRLKRKERCFEKKVRYESRKKLAEKRPRVKGQFVRQVPNESPPGNSTAG